MKKIYDIIAIFIFIALISSVYQVKQGKSEVVSLFGISGVSIISGSMEPNINVGDYVLIKKSNENTLERGDVITFKQNDVLVTHRINDIDENKNYITKGDANNIVDIQHVRYEDVIGKMLISIPLLGLFLLKIRSDFLIIITGIALLILLYNLIKKRRKYIKCNNT